MITALQALANLEAVLNDAILDESSTEIISGWVKVVATELDEQGALQEALEAILTQPGLYMHMDGWLRTKARAALTGTAFERSQT